MKRLTYIAILLIHSIRAENGEDDLDDDDYDPLGYIEEEFFMETDCYLSEKLVLTGENSKKGMFAFEKIYKNELVIKMTEECAICPADVLDVYPFVHYVRNMILICLKILCHFFSYIFHHHM